MWKSILAVFAGFITVAGLAVTMDYILEALTIFPPADEPQSYVTWMFVIAFLYRAAFTVLGGYVTAALAPRNRMKHVKVLAILGTIGGVLGIFAGWGLSDPWYPIALAVTAFPLVWYGGKLRLKKA